MFNPYSILGLPLSATIVEAKIAFRKLAQKHHPDRGGDEEQFKEIKGAWEAIDNGWIAESAVSAEVHSKQYAPQRSSFSAPQAAWQGSYDDPWSPHYRPSQSAAYRAAPRPFAKSYSSSSLPNVVQAYNQNTRKNVGEFIARVSMAEAFRGFICEVQVGGETYRVSIPPGIPDGLRFTIPVHDQSKDDVTVITRFTQSAFEFKSVSTALREAVIVNFSPGEVYRTKDLKITLPILDGRRRTEKLKFESFLGEALSVEVTPEHDLRTPIIIKRMGYVDWYTSHSQAGENRGDVIVQFRPTQIPRIDLSE